MEVWKIIFLSKWVICRFHVNLPGCILWKVSISNYHIYHVVLSLCQTGDSTLLKKKTEQTKTKAGFTIHGVFFVKLTMGGRPPQLFELKNAWFLSAPAM